MKKSATLIRTIIQIGPPFSTKNGLSSYLYANSIKLLESKKTK
jgi:hypothetical protein